MLTLPLIKMIQARTNSLAGVVYTMFPTITQEVMQKLKADKRLDHFVTFGGKRSTATIDGLFYIQNDRTGDFECPEPKVVQRRDYMHRLD